MAQISSQVGDFSFWFYFQVGVPIGSFIFKWGLPDEVFCFGDGSSNATWMVGVHNIGAIKFAEQDS